MSFLDVLHAICLNFRFACHSFRDFNFVPLSCSILRELYKFFIVLLCDSTSMFPFYLLRYFCYILVWISTFFFIISCLCHFLMFCRLFIWFLGFACHFFSKKFIVITIIANFHISAHHLDKDSLLALKKGEGRM